MNNIERKIERLEGKARMQQDILTESIENLKKMINSNDIYMICEKLESHTEYIKADRKKLNELFLQIETLKDIL